MHHRTSETTTSDPIYTVPPTANSVSYAVNNLNQYTSVTNPIVVNPTYDMNGNLTTYDDERVYLPEIKNGNRNVADFGLCWGMGDK
mgnify:CR=1 FL=1